MRVSESRPINANWVCDIDRCVRRQESVIANLVQAAAGIRLFYLQTDAETVSIISDRLVMIIVPVQPSAFRVFVKRT